MSVQQPAQPSLWWMGLVRGVVLVLFGLIMVSWPGRTLVVLLQVLGAYWMVGGVFDLVEGLLGSAKGSRGKLIFGGILSMGAGFMAVGRPVISGVLTGTVLVFLMGAVGLAVGMARLWAGRSGAGEHSLGSWVLGMLYIIFGAMVLFNPLVTQTIILLLLPYWAIVAGIAAMGTSLFMRNKAPAA